MNAAPPIRLVGNDARCVAFVRERLTDVRAAIGTLRGDQCVIVCEGDVFVHDRAATHATLVHEAPDGDWASLSEPAPAGAALLVVLNGNEVGTAVYRAGSRTCGDA